MVLASIAPIDPSDPRFWFWIEQFILLAIAATLVILYSIQWSVERFQDDKVVFQTNVKAQIHRLGLLAAVLGLVQNIDVWGFLGLYPNWLTDFFTAEITCVLISCLILLFRAVVIALYRSHLKRPPGALDVFYWFYAISLFAVATVCLTVGLAINQWWVVSIWLLWVAFVLITLNIAFLIVTILLLVVMKKLEKDAGVEKWRSKFWKRIILLIEALVFAGLAASVAPAQIMSAIQRIQRQTASHGSISFDKGYQPAMRLFTYILWAFSIFILYVSWMPVRCSDKRREADRLAPSEYHRIHSKNQEKDHLLGPQKVAEPILEASPDEENETSSLLRPTRPAAASASTSTSANAMLVNRKDSNSVMEIHDER